MKLLFIHIPKCGGGSINHAFKQYPDIEFIRKGHNVRLPDYKFISEQPIESDYSFAYVRNPYSRAVSAYYHLKSELARHEDYQDRKKYLSPYMDLNDFVQRGLEKALDQMHFIPQVKFIYDGKLLVDRICRLEIVQSEFDDLCFYLGIEPRILKKFKPTNVPKELLTVESKEVIKELYREDFEVLGYG